LRSCPAWLNAALGATELQVSDEYSNEPGEGFDYLSTVHKSSSELFDSFPLDASLTQRDRSTLIQIGTLLSILDRAGSCYWGCNGGDHTLQYLIVRGCSNLCAAVELTARGYYDEAIVLARSAGETANLLWLFGLDSTHLGKWSTLSRGERLRNYSPRAVRDLIEVYDAPPFIDDTLYREQSEKATHATPGTVPQVHSAGMRPALGGLQFSAEAAHYVLDQIAVACAGLAAGGCRMVDVPKPIFLRLNKGAADLCRHLAGV
jgi:hypothetical protein